MLKRVNFTLRQSRRRGNALLELSMVMPILVMLSFGMAEYGYFLYVKNTLQGAAQAGARAAVPYAATNADVNGSNGIVTNMMTAAGIPSSNYTVTLSPSNVSGLAAGTQITVTITANWSAVGVHVLSSSMGGISTSKVVKGVAVMQKESS